jgi:multiple sugar transport system permease protein
MTQTVARPDRIASRPRIVRPRSSTQPVARTASIPFLAPAVIFVGVLLIYPFLASVWTSLFEDNGFSRRFVGLANFGKLAADPILARSLVNTLMWVVGTLVLPVVLGLAIAVASNSLSRRWGAFVRGAIVLPYAISGSATAALWHFLLASDGAVNQVLRATGLGGLATSWLLEWPQNTLSMIVASTWQATGFSVILFLVGLQSIPRDTVEAASIDGASGWRMFASIIFPQLRPVTVVVVGMALVNSLKSFDIVWVLTQGGPARTSETLALTMYRETFLLFHVGYGSAVAVLLTVIVIAAAWLYLRTQLPRVR